MPVYINFCSTADQSCKESPKLPSLVPDAPSILYSTILQNIFQLIPTDRFHRAILHFLYEILQISEI